MARITLADAQSISVFLAPYGIQYEHWPVERRIDPDAPADAILQAYAPEIERLKQQGGYVTADVIDVTAATPNLEAMLERFRREHTHSEDEVRFIVKGSGICHIHPEGGPVFALEMRAGDLINVPRGTRHWFDLCADRCIRAIRLFQDTSGWTPSYTESGLEARFVPLCGPG